MNASLYTRTQAGIEYQNGLVLNQDLKERGKYNSESP